MKRRKEVKRGSSIIRFGGLVAIAIALVIIPILVVKAGTYTGSRLNPAQVSEPALIKKVASKECVPPSQPEAQAADGFTPADAPALDSKLVLRIGTFDPLNDAFPSYGFMQRRENYGMNAGEKHYYIVQFDGPISAEQRLDLLDSGAEIINYIPNNAYLVKASSTVLSNAYSRYRWVGMYEPEFKIQPKLLDKGARSERGEALGPELDDQFIEMRIFSFAGEDVDGLADFVSKAVPEAVKGAVDPGILYDGTITHGCVRVKVPAKHLSRFLEEAANRESVYYIEEAYENKVNLEVAYRIHQADIDAAAATAGTVWNKGLLGEGQIYSSNDSGLDVGECWTKHSAATIYTSSTCGAGGAPPTELCQSKPPSGSSAQALTLLNTQRKVIAYNTPNVNVNPGQSLIGSARWDASGHGDGTTNCATGDNYATIANEPSTTGHDNYDGAAPQAKVIFQDIGGASTTAVYPNDNLYALIKQSFDAGAHVNNNSWGGGSNEYGMDAAQIDRVLWDYPDRVIAWSSGNEGIAAGTLGVQANNKNSIVVGGTQSTFATRENLYIYSSCGPTADGRIKPDVTASANSLTMGYAADNNVTTTTCATSTGIGGTSFASPLVAGYSLLVREYFTKGYYPSGTRGGSTAITPSGALVKGMIMNGAKVMTGTNAGTGFPNSNQGFGRMILENSLYFSGDTRYTKVWDVAAGDAVATGETWERKIGVAAGQQLKITLNWYDPPAFPGGAIVLVNDLDLEVVGPTGLVYHGNQTSTTTPFDSTSGATAYDRANTAELFELNAPTAGTYTIRVKGYNVPGAGSDSATPRQPFAVVATGGINNNQGVISAGKAVFVCGDNATITLVDANASGSPTVTLTTVNGDSETVTLTGTAPDFSGSIPIAFNTPVTASNGTLEAGAGETVTITYIDASPAVTVTSTAVLDCNGKFGFESAIASGGCDSDDYLDADEAVTMTVTIKNAQTFNMNNVTLNLVSNDANVFVEQPTTKTIGTINAGATGSQTFTVYGRSGLAFGTASMTAFVNATGLQTPQRIDFEIRVETDQNDYPGSWSYGFDSTWTYGTTYVDCANYNLYDGSQWLIIQGAGDIDCSTWTSAWARTTTSPCFQAGTGAMKTFACGTNYGNAQDMRIISPDITTGPAGSTTTLTDLTYYHSLDFGRGDCSTTDSCYAFTFLKTPTTYNGDFVGNTGTGTTGTVIPKWTLKTIDLSAWNFDDDPGLSGDPFTTVSIFFEMHTQARVSGCTAADLGWNFDTVTLNWINHRYEADGTAGCSSCTAPGTPTSFAVSSPSSNLVRLTWAAGTGTPDHYNIYRAGDGKTAATCASAFTKIATVFAPTVTYDDTVSGGVAYAYKITAANATDECESAYTTCYTQIPAGSCNFPPNPVTGLVATDNPNAGACRITLTWTASTPQCTGDTVLYNIYRSTGSFTPGPAYLIAPNVSGTTYNDTQVLSGYNAAGDPTGPIYYYAVRAVDSINKAEETNTTVVSRRASNGTTAGTWSDSAGDGGSMAKMQFVSRCGGPINWTTSTLENHTGSGANSYRSVVAASANNRAALYNDSNCSALVSPSILVGTSPQISFWHRLNVEALWDGLVLEVKDCGSDPDCNSGTWSATDPTVSYTTMLSDSPTGDCGGSEMCGDVYPYPSGDGTTYINDCDYPSTGVYALTAGSGTITAWAQATATLPAAYNSGYIQFRINLSSDCAGNYEGAYIDDLAVTQALIPVQCTSTTCPTGPTFYGLFSAVDVSATADSGIALTWYAPSAWGSGTASLYKVYRDGAFIADVTPPTTTYTDNPPLNNTTYTYSVKAINSCGAADSSAQYRDAMDAFTSSCTMTVDVTPNGTTSVCTNANIVFTATRTGGTAPFTYQWTENGANISGATTSTLTRTKAAAGSFTYNCKVSDASTCVDIVDSTSSTGTWVAPPTSVSVTPSGTTTVCTGVNITFTATVVGGSSQTYQWTENGSNVSGATNSTYTVSKAAAGSFTINCSVANPGCATAVTDATPSTATWVAPPTSVTVTPSGTVTVCTGTNVIFTATVAGGATPQYQWTENGTNISGATNSTYLVSKAATGSFNYTCIVNNTGCATTVTDATPSTGSWVAPPTSVDVTPNGATTVCTGASITFTATVTGGATPLYQWTEGGSNIAGATNSTYTVSKGAAGTFSYNCRVNNTGCATVTTDATASAGTWVAPPTSVTVTPSGTTTVCTGVNIVFTATVVGGATPLYQWTENGSNIAGATNSTYTANKAAAGSFNYTCIVNNTGCATTVTDATPSTGTWVSPPTVDVTPNGTTTVCTGANIIFTATASAGTAPYTYQWTENGSNIAGATNSTYTANKAAAGSFTYNCLVYSTGCATAGTDATVSTGTWVSPPTVDVTPNGTTQVTIGNPITFTATASAGTAPYTYQWTRDGGDIAGATNSTLTENYGTVQTHSYNCKVASTGCATVAQDATASTGDWISGGCTNPAEVANQQWTDVTTHTWDALVPAPTSYILYRGQLANLADLPTGAAANSCTRYTGAANSINTVTEDPTALAAGDFYWYLVIGHNDPTCDGTAGTGRIINTSGACP